MYQTFKKSYNYILHLTNNYYKFILHFFRSISSMYYGISVAEKKYQSLIIPYTYEGKRYILYVPYEKKYINRMINSNIELVYEDTNMKLEQQPGVPYLIAPKHLGAKYAKIYTIDDIKIVESNDIVSI